MLFLGGMLDLAPSTLDQAIFLSYNVIENKAHFVLESPLYNPIRYKFPSMFENIVQGSLKSFD